MLSQHDKLEQSHEYRDKVFPFSQLSMGTSLIS